MNLEAALIIAVANKIYLKQQITPTAYITISPSTAYEVSHRYL